MFVDMKRIAIVPLLVAFALARVHGYPTVASRCKAVSEVHLRGKSDGLIRYVETAQSSEPPVVQLIMPFQFLTSKPVSYAALAFRAEDVDKRCITKGQAKAKTLSFQQIRVSKFNSTLVAWMTPASLSPGSVHNIVGYNVAVYRFIELTEFLWTHFLQNYNDYRPIGCGIVRYADCSDKVTPTVPSSIQPTAARQAWLRASTPASLLQPVWAHISSDERSLELESADEPNLTSAEEDKPIPELEPADKPKLTLAPKNEPIPEPKPTDKPSSVAKSIPSENKSQRKGSSERRKAKGNWLSDRLSAWTSTALSNIQSGIKGITQRVKSEVKEISERAKYGIKRLSEKISKRIEPTRAEITAIPREIKSDLKSFAGRVKSEIKSMTNKL